MKALLLAGGRGTRFRPLTHTINKHALPIANRPLLLYPFLSIVEAGIKEIAVVVNETRPEIEALLGDGSKWKVRVDYILQDHPGGLAHALSLAEDFMGNSKFVMVLGDNMLQKGMTQYVKEFEENGSNAHILGVKIPKSQHKRMGMVTLAKDGKHVVQYIEKPGVVEKSRLYKPERSYAGTGFYFFDKNVFKSFKGKDKIKPSKRGELEISGPYNWLLDHGHTVTFSEVDGWWKDPGNPRDLLVANQLVLSAQETSIESRTKKTEIEGKVQIGRKCKVEGSRIRGPVIIGKGCKIINSYIGPFTSISDDCELINSEVENSIVMMGSKISDVEARLDSCLIGQNTSVSMKSDKPRSVSLFVGDNSEIEL